MDVDDFEDSNGSSHFIVVDSQTETQECDQQEILRSLPALRQVDQASQPSQVVEVTEAVTLKPKVLVSATDSDVDFHAHSPTNIKEVIMETQSEEKSSSQSSEQEGDETVIENKEMGKDGQSTSKSSSKQFQLFRPSMSENDTCQDNSDEEPMVATPAQYIGSLHFSGQPLLVPESVDESLNELSASPGAYGDHPVIIPSTPTKLGEDDSDEPDEVSMLHHRKASQMGSSQNKTVCELKQSDCSFASQDLALHLSPSQGDSMFIHDKGNSQKTQKKLTKTKSASQPEMSEKLGSNRAKSNSSSTDSGGGFHLSLPSEGTLFHPVLPQSTEKPHLVTREAVSMPTVAPSLNLALLDTSQSTGDAVFHLEKPDLHLTETVEESEVNIFHKAKAGSSKPRHVVIHESSEDFLGFQSEKPRDKQSLEKSVYDESTEIYEQHFGDEEELNTRESAIPAEEQNRERESRQVQPMDVDQSQSVSGKGQPPPVKRGQVSADNADQGKDSGLEVDKRDTQSVSRDKIPSDPSVSTGNPAESGVSGLMGDKKRTPSASRDNVTAGQNRVLGLNDKQVMRSSDKVVVDPVKSRVLVPGDDKPGTSSASRDKAAGDAPGSSKADKTDPYAFHGSQSQSVQSKQTGSAKKVIKSLTQSYPQTPLSSKKRKLLHRKTSIKRGKNVSTVSSTELEDNSKVEQPPVKKRKPSLKKFTELLDRQTSLKSPATGKTAAPNVTATHKAKLTMSPTSTTRENQPETSVQSSCKRRNVEFADIEHSEVQHSMEQALSGSPDSDELMEKTTIVETTRIHRHIKVIVMSAKDGHVVRTTEREEEDKPIFLREVVVTKRLSPFISPSRTNSSLTSGDLGDVSSSSLSRHNSSGSKGSSLEKAGSSLDIASLSKSQPEVIPRQEESAFPDILDDHSDEANATPDVSVIEKTDSRYGAVVSSAESKKTDSLFTSPEAQKTSVAVLSGKSPLRQRMADSSEESSGIPAAQVSRSKSQPSRLSDSSSDFLLAQEKEVRPRSQESAGFSVRGSGVTVSGSPQLNRLSAFKKAGTAVSQTEKALQNPGSSDDGDKLSPEIPLQMDLAAGETSTMRTPTKGHYASKLEKGAVVMARWRDGFYYPGRIVSMDEIARYRIQFDDGDSRLVKIKDILLIEQLPIGQSVMVMSQDGYFDCGLIVEHVHQANTLKYTVELDDGSKKKCLRSEIILSEDQASCLMSDEELRITISTPGHVTSKPAEVSLDNLIEGSRRSESKAKAPDKTDDVPLSTGKQKRQTEITVPDKADDVPQSTEMKKRGRSLQAASTPTPNKAKSVVAKLSGRTPRRPVARTPRKTRHRLRSLSPSPLGGAVNSPISMRKSPRKEKGSPSPSTSGAQMKIFAGMVFLLSHVDKSLEQREQEKKMLEDSSLETSADENLVDEDQLFAFDKEYLRTEIERMSGLVIDKYNKIQVDAAIACYLISDTYQRTIKYLQCLAAGIPCVSHLWVRESCRQGKRLDIKAYLLPAGISLQRRKLMEWTPYANCLEHYKVMVTSTNTKFIDAWTETMAICKCQLFNRLPGPNATDNMLDVVITDNTCPTNILRRAQKLGIPVVSTEWVIQCLINGHQVGFDIHPRYRHDFVEK